jgi:hypothetical protein
MLGNVVGMWPLKNADRDEFSKMSCDMALGIEAKLWIYSIPGKLDNLLLNTGT